MFGQNVEVWEVDENSEGDELVELAKERKMKM
jgi:hypothetical protein